MSLPRDVRDPAELGKLLRQLRKLAPEVPITQLADELPSYYVSPGDPNPSCVDRYGRPEDVTEKWERIQIR